VTVRVVSDALFLLYSSVIEKGVGIRVTAHPNRCAMQHRVRKKSVMLALTVKHTAGLAMANTSMLVSGLMLPADQILHVLPVSQACLHGS
jgi:hypothetical protein